MQARGRFALWSLKLPKDEPCNAGRFTLYPLRVAREDQIKDVLKDFRFEQSCLLNSYSQMFPSLLVSFTVRQSGEVDETVTRDCWIETVIEYARFRLALQRLLRHPIRARTMGVCFSLPEDNQVPVDEKTGQFFRGRLFPTANLDPTLIEQLPPIMAELDTERLRRLTFPLTQYDRGVWEERPCDRLLNYVMALESLFIESDERGPKGTPIADRCVALLAKHCDHTTGVPGLRPFLIRVYQERNAIVHGSPSLAPDCSIQLSPEVDLDRLDAVVFASLWWSAVR